MLRSVLIFAVLVAMLGSTAARSEGKASSAPPLIAVVGDSLGDGMWGGLARTTQKDKRIRLFRGAKNSVGFTGSDLIDMLDRAFAAGEVQAVVVMIGANDRRSFFVDGKPKALINSPDWIKLYRGRAERFMDHVGRKGIPLIWIALPAMRSNDASVDASIINGIIEDAAHGRPFVHVINTFRITADEKGAYLPHFKDLNGNVRQMRLGDGVHFETPAYELFADLVLRKLQDVSPRFKVTVAD